MDFKEYLDKVINVAEEPEDLEYKLIGMLWPHPEHFPVKLMSLGGRKTSIVKLPKLHDNKRGFLVPIITFDKELFVGQEHITDIILPSSLRTIPEAGLAGLKNLKRITIPRGVRTIFQRTFESCVNLEDVYYEGSEEEWDEINIIHEGYRVANPEHLGLYCNIERYDIPGNEPLFSANIHFNCSTEDVSNVGLAIRMGNKDVTNLFTMQD